MTGLIPARIALVPSTAGRISASSSLRIVATKGEAMWCR
jgi:hypothetical protein